MCVCVLFRSGNAIVPFREKRKATRAELVANTVENDDNFVQSFYFFSASPGVGDYFSACSFFRYYLLLLYHTGIYIYFLFFSCFCGGSGAPVFLFELLVVW